MRICSRKCRHIIWDWNGTLFDDAWLCVEVINDLLRRRGLALLTRDLYQEVFGFPIIDYYRRAGFDFEGEPFETLAHEFIAAYDARKRECRLQDGAREALEFFARHGVGQSILSATKRTMLTEWMEHYELGRYLTHVVGLDDHYAASKIENGRQLIRELACPPEEVLMIGDTLHDFEVAAAMGVDCLLVPGGHHAPRRLAGCGGRVLRGLRELLALCEPEG
jgi:phosphoglycolate phosphatase